MRFCGREEKCDTPIYWPPFLHGGRVVYEVSDHPNWYFVQLSVEYPGHDDLKDEFKNELGDDHDDDYDDDYQEDDYFDDDDFQPYRTGPCFYINQPEKQMFLNGYRCFNAAPPNPWDAEGKLNEVAQNFFV